MWDILTIGHNMRYAVVYIPVKFQLDIPFSKLTADHKPIFQTHQGQLIQK